MTATAAPWRDGERVRVVGYREPSVNNALPLGAEGVIQDDGDRVLSTDGDHWCGPALNAYHRWERVPAEPPAPTPEPVLHVRADQLPLMLEVVAAARAWAKGAGAECLRLSDAVAAYERAIGDGA
jgi:hypothetical protein